VLYLIDLTRQYNPDKTWNCGWVNMELSLVKLEISVLLIKTNKTNVGALHTV